MADEQTLEPQKTEEPKVEAPKVEAAKVEAPLPDVSLAGQLKALGIASAEPVKDEAAPKQETAVPMESAARTEGGRPPRGEQGKSGGQPRRDQGQRPPREARPPQAGGGAGAGGPRPGGGPPNREGHKGAEHRGAEHRGGEHRGGDRGEKRTFGGDRPRFDVPEIELEKLIADSLYLDNQAHAIVIRMRDMESGTKTQLRRLYNAVRRAVRAPETERQHEFVMLRARLAYTIARHSLRSLDQIEKLLLQVTRKNESRGYERFKDLFEAIVAYNE